MNTRVELDSETYEQLLELAAARGERNLERLLEEAVAAVAESRPSFRDAVTSSIPVY